MKRKAVPRTPVVHPETASRQFLKDVLYRSVLYLHSLYVAESRLLESGRLSPQDPRVPGMQLQASTMKFFLREFLLQTDEQCREILRSIPEKEREELIERMMNDICPLVIMPKATPRVPGFWMPPQPLKKKE